MGCPAGIGPEIIIKYFNENRHHQIAWTPIVIGSASVLHQTAAALGITIPVADWTPGKEIKENTINVLDNGSRLTTVQPGLPDRETGRAMADYIKTAVDLCQSGILAGMTTCPISKESLNRAGYDFPGHTEFLKQLTSSRQAVMMMHGTKLTVTLVTIHCSLQSVSEYVSEQAVEKLIRVTDHSLKTDFNNSNPRIGVAGLNPHAGEKGLFGTEETMTILPAIERCSRDGIRVDGPLPPDTIFYKAASGLFDAVVCMYHDQGLIPFKLLHFEDGVNITLGLPIIRTSVDHGTAYDIAGKGVASCSSLRRAVETALLIATNRNNT